MTLIGFVFNGYSNIMPLIHEKPGLKIISLMKLKLRNIVSITKEVR
jgi:hypothetical protein